MPSARGRSRGRGKGVGRAARSKDAEGRSAGRGKGAGRAALSEDAEGRSRGRGKAAAGRSRSRGRVSGAGRAALSTDAEGRTLRRRPAAAVECASPVKAASEDADDIDCASPVRADADDIESVSPLDGCVGSPVPMVAAKSKSKGKAKSATPMKAAKAKAKAPKASRAVKRKLAQREVLFTDNILAEILKAQLALLPAKTVNRMRALLIKLGGEAKTIHIASLCSGSEIAFFSMAIFVNIVTKGAVAVLNTFSCESDARKQKYIKHCIHEHPWADGNGCIFKNIEDTERERTSTPGGSGGRIQHVSTHKFDDITW
jgi:hypothetical protein